MFDENNLSVDEHVLHHDHLSVDSWCNNLIEKGPNQTMGLGLVLRCML
jgi:hypothetical protein